MQRSLKSLNQSSFYYHQSDPITPVHPLMHSNATEWRYPGSLLGANEAEGDYSAPLVRSRYREELIFGSRSVN